MTTFEYLLEITADVKQHINMLVRKEDRAYQNKPTQLKKNQLLLILIQTFSIWEKFTQNFNITRN